MIFSFTTVITNCVLTNSCYELFREAMANYAGLELHEACATGDSDAVEECIKSGIDVNTQDTDWNDRTPLHWACMKGHGDIVQLLLKNEADPNLLMENGWNSLHSAAETGHLSIIRALVQYGGDIFKQDRYGDTPRKLAQIHGNGDCVKYLYGVERQICDDIMKKAEEERLAAEAAAAAALEARAAAGPSNEKKKLDETNDALATESPVKVVTLVEGPPATWKVGPTGSILKRSLSTSMNNSSKQTSKRSTRK